LLNAAEREPSALPARCPERRSPLRGDDAQIVPVARWRPAGDFFREMQRGGHAKNDCYVVLFFEKGVPP
jgi:hypothetical protein